MEIATGPDPERHPNDVVILVDIEPSVNWRFETEVGGWKRIVMNLLGNSLKYTDRGQIEVRLCLIDELDDTQPEAKPENHICLQVSDTGRGMSADYLRHGLFKPFVQENSLSTGTGLGLSIVQRLVESLSGTIDVQSKLGVGTRTRIRIPIGVKTQPADEKPATDNRNGGNSLDPESLLLGRTLILPAVSATELSDAHQQGSRLAVRALLASIAQDWLGMKIVASNDGDHGGTADVFTLLPKVKPDGSLGSDWTLRTPFLSHTSVSTDSVTSKGPAFAKEIILSPFSPRNVARAFLGAGNSGAMREMEIPSGRTLQKPMDRGAFANGQTVKTSTAEESVGNHTKVVTYNILDQTAQGTATNTKIDRQNHVLLVDDNSVNLNILSKVVQMAGCSFVKASNGQQAVEAFTTTTTPFDLILMDLSMPVMDGFTATRHIRAHELSIDGLSRCARIVALTALGSAASREEAFASGIDGRRS